MIPLTLRRETSQQLVFVHQHRAGWVLMAVGLALYGGLALLAGREWRELWSLDNGIFFGSIVCALLVGVGLFAGLWRHQLTIDRARRQWQRRVGLWPFIRHRRGDLDDRCQVTLKRKNNHDVHHGASNRYPVFLELGDGRRVPLGLENAKILGERLMVEMARRMQVPAADHSQRMERATAWQELEMPPDPFAR